MGAWDATSFGNDAANDWAHDLVESDDLSPIESALQRILDAGEGDLATGDSERAIAAAEVVAWMLGHPSRLDAFTAKIGAWVIAHPVPPSSSVREMALATVDRIGRAPSSLLELWDGDPGWTAALADLRARLSV